VAVVGLGGVGKTQIALEFAYRTIHRNPSCAIFWVPAVSLSTFEHAYMEIAKLLGIAEIGRDKVDVRNRIKERLSSESAGEWLMIIDNADDPNLLLRTGEDESENLPLIDYLPSSRLGSIIFTTRTQQVAAKVANTVVKVSEMAEKDATEVFEKSLTDKLLLRDVEAVNKLLQLLTYLPLAIVQAAAFINENSMSVSEYSFLYEGSEDEAIEVLSQDFEDPARYRDIKNPVATTWLISFNRIRKHNPLAAEYMSYMACVVREDIPQSFLLTGASRPKMSVAIGTLLGYSFITKRQETNSYDMHRLVYLATRSWLKREGQLSYWTDKTLTRTANIVSALKFRGSLEWRTYLPHTIYVLASSGHSSEYRMEISDLLEFIAHCQYLHGQYRKSTMSHQRALKIQQKLYGVDHIESIGTMLNVGALLFEMGSYIEAEEFQNRTFELSMRVLGREHTVTLKSMSNIARRLTAQGKHEEGEQMNRRTLELRERVLGREHPNTLVSMINLASVLLEQGKYEEAEQINRQTLEIGERVSGREHPDTLASMNSLAAILLEQGKYEEAEEMSRQALELGERVSGREHPDTLVSMSNLAEVVAGQEKYEEAKRIHLQTLELREKVLGRAHPHTLTTMYNLASVLFEQGEYEETEKIIRQTSELRQHVLGADHPDTLASMKNLASVLLKQGKYEEAGEILLPKLEQHDQVLDHQVDHAEIGSWVHPRHFGRMRARRDILPQRKESLVTGQQAQKTSPLILSEGNVVKPEILSPVEGISGQVLSSKRMLSPDAEEPVRKRERCS
jgi:tetratricopeptide (TPR) repeat protein